MTGAGLPMIDPFGRRVTYLRVSVTDRCNMRCVYCMAEDMVFEPRSELLTLEEVWRLCGAFVRKGVRKIRLTGGEPLVRRGIMELVDLLGSLVRDGSLDELTMTTNGAYLAEYAQELAAAGIRRINVSLDSLDPTTFANVTRWGTLDKVVEGIMAARRAGLAVKINTVALKGVNDGEFDRLVEWCGWHGLDLSLIETMPMGEAQVDRADHYLSLDTVRRQLERRWTLINSDHQTGGPSRYARVAETGRHIGFITPMSHNFCASCNRVRVTCTGKLFMCLGQEDEVDLCAPLRASEADVQLEHVIDQAISRKSERHGFLIRKQIPPTVGRHMNVTGG